MMTGVNTNVPRVAAPGRPASQAESAPVDRVAAVDGKNAPASGNSLPASVPIDPPPKLDIADVVRHLAALARDSRRGVRFRVDESSGRTVITVLNETTDEIVRQIPEEEILNIARALRLAQQKTSLIDDQA
jgi:flagellar protein FlaG